MTPETIPIVPDTSRTQLGGKNRRNTRRCVSKRKNKNKNKNKFAKRKSRRSQRRTFTKRKRH